MGTLGNLRNNSKPIIWFVIIVVLIGFVGIGAFSVIAQNKLELFGMHDPERASLAIDGEISRHDGQNRNDALSYINTFSGNSTGTIFNFFPNSALTYNRHIQTLEELKGKVLSKNMYEDFYKSDISDVDIITFLITELKQSTNSPLYSSPSIRKIQASFNSTSFDGYGEDLDDRQDGIWNPGEDFTDSNGNRVWDEGERFVDGNGIWDNAEQFTDANENGEYDDGEDFVDLNGNDFWDDAETYTDLGNNIWDEGEEFTDTNENGEYDDGEDFVDAGDGKWNNGVDAWLEDCLQEEKLDYSKIRSRSVAGNVKSYIDLVASYEIKYKKHEQLFNSLNLALKSNIEDQYLINNSNAKVSYISYDLSNIDESSLISKIDTQKINSEIPDFENMELGALSTPFLTVVLILLIIFAVINRDSRAKFSTGVVFSILFLIIIVFKSSGTSPENHQFKQISYLYVMKGSQENFTDSKNGVFDSGTDHDCGLDNICKGDEEWVAPDEDGTEDDGIVESEELLEDLNGNGIYDEGDAFEDSDNNGKWNEIEKWEDSANGSYDEGEEFNDCGFNPDGNRICEGQDGWDKSFGNGVWDSAEDVLEQEKEKLINEISSTSFQDSYNDRSNGSKTNGLLSGSNVVLSKGFSQKNSDNLRSHLSILLDVINSAFKTAKGETFVVSNKDFQDNLQGYFIGYVEDEGNLFYKSNYDEIEKDHLEKEKENFVLNNKIFDVDEFTENLYAIEFEGADKETIIKNYADKDITLSFNEAISSLSIDGSGIIEGTLLEMQPLETSNVLFASNKAYLIYMHEKEEANISDVDYESLNDTGIPYSFSNVFNENKNGMSVVDWRGEASFNRVVGSNAAGAATENIEDIYLNFNNFKSVFYNQ